jgi:hypothetical protein
MDYPGLPDRVPIPSPRSVSTIELLYIASAVVTVGLGLFGLDALPPLNRVMLSVTVVFLAWSLPLAARMTVGVLRRADSYDGVYDQAEQYMDGAKHLGSMLATVREILTSCAITAVDMRMLDEEPYIIIKPEDPSQLTNHQAVCVLDIKLSRWLGRFEVTGPASDGYYARPVKIWDGLWWGKTRELAISHDTPPRHPRAIVTRLD